MLRRLLAGLALVVAITPRVLAQSVEVEATLNDSAVWVGDPVLLQISVSNADAPTEPEPPVIEGVDVERTQSGVQTNFFQFTVNGRTVTKNSVSFAFRLTPQRAGEFVVPPVSVRVDGQEYRTQPVRFVARQPSLDPDFELEIALETQSAYVGQPVHARVSWFVAGNARNFAFTASSMPESIEVVPLPAPGAASADRFQFRAFGAQIEAVQQFAVRNNVRHPVLVFDVMLIPRREGDFEIGPAQVVFDRVENRLLSRRISRSNSPQLSVLPLPLDGQPPDFTGLVGKFSIEAQAGPTDVNVGDPISLSVDIHGPEPLAGVTPPDLTLDPAVSERFKPSPDGWEPQARALAGQRRFDTTIRARTSEVDAIPPIRLPFFDPETGQYAYAESDPIELNVRQTRRVTAADAIMGPGRATAPTRDPLARSEDGAWALETDPDRLLRSDAFDLARTVRSPAVVAAIGAPPLVYAATSGVLLVRRRRDPEAVRRRAAGARARRLLRAGKAPEGVRAWVASVSGQEESSVTAEDARSLFDTPEAELLAATLRADEWGRYTGSDQRPAHDASPSELSRAIRTLERSLARERGRA